MLVDNGVNGDSRVQKEARSAAEAGWEVILLGLSPDEQARSWHLGRAEVRLLPAKRHLGKRPYEYRRSLRYGLLGYPPNGFALYRIQKMKAWQADVRVRRAQLTLEIRKRRPRKISVARVFFKARKERLRVESLFVRANLKWVLMRYRHQKNAKLKRRDLAGPWDRFVTWFWLTTKGDKAWRRLEPRLWDYELAYGPVIDKLTPDVIHANDFRMLGVGARAVIRARAAGRPVKLVWDAHEYAPGLHRGTNSARWLPAIVAHEREYARFADAVTTVSPALADLLQKEHRLPERPEVVLNAPEANPEIESEGGDGGIESAGDVRSVCGLDPHTPLVVYSGGIAPVRGVEVMVEALPKLPDVHVALVSVPPGKPVGRYTQAVLDLADRLGVRDRVHLLPYVAHWQVASFLSTADAACSPLVHLPNHEIALSNKFFEYAHARLPMVVSDIRFMADTTREIGQGEVFRAQDVDDYVRAVQAVLAAPESYRAAYDKPGLLDGWTWEPQAEVLDAVYTRLVPPSAAGAVGVPEVSVVMAVNNAMPYLTRCIRSLLEQSLGMSRFEVIAIDEGSTDGGVERLARFAELYPLTFKVGRDGDPARRMASYNQGLARASGRYVLFLGAEDHLGPEALERLVAAADERASDVVIPRIVGTGDPWESHERFTGGNRDSDAGDPALALALSNRKLFRREFIERHEIRFAEDIAVGGDELFTIEACVRAGRMSVLADYDFYHAVRPRIVSSTRFPAGLDELLNSTADIMRVAARLAEPGPVRDGILYRYFAVELSGLVDKEFVSLERQQQERICAGVRELVNEFLTADISERLEVGARVRLALAQRGLIDALVSTIQQDSGQDAPSLVAEDGALYLRYRCFRDPELSIPDSLFSVTRGVARAVGNRAAVRTVMWEDGGSGVKSLTVTAHIPAQLAHLGVASVHMMAGSLAGTVDLVADPDGAGTVVRSRFSLSDIVVAVGRTAVRLKLDAYEGCDVPMRINLQQALPTQYVSQGYRPYRIKPTQNAEGYLVIDVVPVTARRVVASLQSRLRGQGRKVAAR
jgi:glycosyltransferase involved in cell wall biosynthesis